MIFIGDVHGCYKTLMALLKQLPEGEKLCFLGDLIDRGLDSDKVVKFVRKGQHDCVMGNHERMMFDAVCNEDPYFTSIWKDNGGRQTIQSYKGFTDQLRSDARWMSDLPYFIEYPGIRTPDGRMAFASHAGLYDDRGEEEFNELRDRLVRTQDIIWHRDPIGNFEWVYQVIGHTPRSGAVVEKHFANIDTGACFDRQGYGVLTALQFPQMKLFTQPNAERES